MTDIIKYSKTKVLIPIELLEDFEEAKQYWDKLLKEAMNGRRRDR